jgi:RHS repeat-associated protein
MKPAITHIRKLIFISFLIIVETLCVYGKKIAYSSTPISVQPANSLDLMEDNIPNTTFSPWGTETINDRIEIYFKKESPVYLNAPFTFSVTFTLTEYDVTNTQIGAAQLKTMTLTYDPANPYNDLTYITFSGAHHFTVTLINPPVITPTCPPGGCPEVMMEGYMDIERFYPPNCGYVVGVSDLPQNYTPFSNTVYTAGNNTLTVNWPVYDQADAYEFEWTFVDNVNPDNQAAPIDKSLLSYTFDNHCTRIITADNYYEITAAFPSGWILYRVRPIFSSATDPMIFGLWTDLHVPNTGLVSDFQDGAGNIMGRQVRNKTETGITEPDPIFEFDPNLNWRYEADFAEDGKKKEITAYFDGTLRNRQGVERLSTEHTAMIQETIYDYLGRAAIHVLPAPDYKNNLAQKNDISYHSLFNLNTAGNIYSNSDFDADLTSCSNTPAPMDNSTLLPHRTTGAAYFYSANNSQKGSIEHGNFIADAGQFPFSQTKYMRDNTNRVKAQTVPGEGYTVGSNHESQYFYSTPGQAELDMLFGSEAGNSAHYEKILTRDPNGQFTVEYKDMTGKVVATALDILDEPIPQNLSLLPNIPAPVTITDNLNSKNISDNNRIVMVDNFMVTKPGIYTVDYTLDLTTMHGDCFQQTCSDCSYDVTFNLVNECGISIWSHTQNFGNPASAINENCTTPNPPSGHYNSGNEINITAIGNYTLTKTLTVDQQALDNQAANYMAYIQQHPEKTSNSCFTTRDQYTTTETANYENKCPTPLTPKTDCGHNLNLMIKDMDPMQQGQYAGWKTDNFGTNPHTNGATDYPLSIMNNDYNSAHTNHNQLPHKPALNLTHPDWQHPYDSISDDRAQYSVIAATPGAYYEFSGTTCVRSVISYDKANNYPPVNDVSLTFNDADGNYYTYPENLTNYMDFLAHWKSSWARSLVVYHPEFFYYNFCNMISPGKDFDQKLMMANTYQDALKKGLIAVSSSQVNFDLTLNDPFFTTTYSASGDNTFGYINDAISGSGANSWRSKIRDKMQNYFHNDQDNKEYTIFDFAVYQSMCPDCKLEDPNNKCQNADACIYNYDNTLTLIQDDMTNSAVSCAQDAIWVTIKSLYLSQKLAAEDDMMQQYAVLHQCYDGGIGNPGFNPFTDNYLSNCYHNVPLNPSFECFDWGSFSNIPNSYDPHNDGNQPAWQSSLYSLTLSDADKLLNADQHEKSPKTKRWGSNAAIEDGDKKKITDILGADGNNQTNVTNDVNGKLSGSLDCKNTCDNYRPEWRKLMVSCGIPDSDTSALAEQLSELCQRGCDLTHMYGASSVPASDTRYPQNFRDVLNDYWKAHNNNQNFPRTDVCNVDLISMPPPYNQNLFGGNDNLSTLDKCVCDKVTKAYNTFHAYNPPPAGIQTAADEFLKENNIPLIEFDDIKCQCDHAWILGYPSEIAWNSSEPCLKVISDQLALDKTPVPNGVSCAQCLTCQAVQDAITSFNAANPQLLGTQGYYQILQNTLNGQFGFSLSSDEYLTFNQSCNSATQTLNSCNTLSAQGQELNQLIQTLFVIQGPVWRSTNMDLSLYPSLYSGNCTTAAATYNFRQVEDHSSEANPVNVTNSIIATISDGCGYYCGIVFKFDPHINPNTIISVVPNSFTHGTGPYDFSFQAVAAPNTVFTITGTSCYAVTSCPPPAPADVCAEDEYLDQCSYDLFTSLSNELIFDQPENQPIYRQDPGFISAMHQLFVTKFGNTAYPRNLDSQLSEWRRDLQTMIGSNITLFNGGMISPVAWSAVILNRIGNEHDNDHKIPGFLACHSCKTCGQISQVVFDNEQINGFSSADPQFYSKLHDQLVSALGYEVHLVDKTPPGVTDSKNFLVCDQLSTEGTDLFRFLKALVYNHNLLESNMPLYNGYYDDRFVNTSLAKYNKTTCNMPMYSSFLDASGNLVINLSELVTGWHCQVTLNSNAGQCADFGQIIAINSITGYYTASGNNFNFSINVTVTDASGTRTEDISGFSECYPITTCCMVNSQRLCNRPVFKPVTQNKNSCQEHLDELRDYVIDKEFKDELTDLEQKFRAEYTAKCLAQANEQISLQYQNTLYHFTLYYYDAAGNLIKTLPPEGVSPINLGATCTTCGKTANQSLTYQKVIENFRADPNNPNNEQVYPPQEDKNLFTVYNYNTLNHVVWSQSPDAGITQDWYDRLGRPVLTQNAAQAARHNPPTDNNYYYSYTRYDALGRVYETGELATQTQASIALALDDDQLKSFIDKGVSRTQLKRTLYDEQSACVSVSISQKNLRNRVASIVYMDTDEDEDENANPNDPDNCELVNYATHYSYDEQGFVQYVYQQFPELSGVGYEFFTMYYQYDIISGKMNEVHYQEGKEDQFFHRYDYDADNRITGVRTSRDNIHWPGGNIYDAAYKYYLHGPLARMELGTYQVQGVDYAYTLQGWLKGVNDNTLVETDDMGRDGDPTAPANQWFARDAYGFTLGYNDSHHDPTTLVQGDYVGIGGAAVTFEKGYDAFCKGQGMSGSTIAPPLYNGNIRSVSMNIRQTTAMGVQFGPLAGAPPNPGPNITGYYYDQLNRLINTQMLVYNPGPNTWMPLQNYHEEFTYDGNGNINTLKRRDENGGGVWMDDLSYTYNKTAGKLDNNRLPNVTDNSAYAVAGVTDIRGSNTYTYDAMGNLSSDANAGITEIDWSLYDKVTDVKHAAPTSQNPDLSFRYGPDGNRVVKIVKSTVAPDGWVYTYYVRDAQGNIMATYNKTLHTVNTLQNTDYNTLINQIVSDNGQTMFNNFFGWAFGNIQGYNFVGAFNTDIINAGDQATIADDYADPDDAQWLTTVSATAKTAILGHYHDVDYAHALLFAPNDVNHQSDKQTVIHWFLTDCSSNATLVITDYLDADCYNFLMQIASSNHTSFVNIYNHFPLLPPSGGLTDAQMTDSLCAKITHATISSYLVSNYEPLLETILSTKTVTDLYSHISARTDFSCMDAHLLSVTDLIWRLASDNQNTMTGVFTTEATTLLPIIEANDPSGFLTHCLVINPGWAVQELNHLNYPINSFIGLVMRYYGSAYAKTLETELPGLTICNFNEVFSLNDLHIYGQKRIGVQNENMTIVSTNFIGAIVNNNLITGPACNYPVNYAAPDYTHHMLGKVSYELSNHLGNVMVTISDRKIAHSTNGTTVDYYMPDERSATDYYAFGNPMYIRNWTAPNENYRYGFNDKEHDNEIKGGGNSYDYGFRMYDPRAGRFMSVDPLIKRYPFYSSYQFAGNSPIKFIDIDGLEPFDLHQALTIAAPFVAESNAIPIVGEIADGLYVATVVYVALTDANANADANAVPNNNTATRAEEKTVIEIQLPAEPKAQAKQKQQKNPKGRNKNRRKSHEKAEGDHSTLGTRNSNKKIKGYTTFKKNPKGEGYHKVKSVDVEGRPHNDVPTPHVQEGSDPTRPARPDELPKNPIIRNPDSPVQ